MSTELKALLFSIGIMFLVSCLGGFIAYLITPNLRIIGAVFMLTTIIQFLVGYFISALKDKSIQKLENIINQIENEKREATLIPLTCAYCHKKNMVPITLDKVNGFTCECKGYNKVMIQFMSVRGFAEEILDNEKDTSLIEEFMSESTVNDTIKVLEK